MYGAMATGSRSWICHYLCLALLVVHAFILLLTIPTDVVAFSSSSPSRLTLSLSRSFVTTSSSPSSSTSSSSSSSIASSGSSSSGHGSIGGLSFCANPLERQTYEDSMAEAMMDTIADDDVEARQKLRVDMKSRVNEMCKDAVGREVRVARAQQRLGRTFVVMEDKSTDADGEEASREDMLGVGLDPDTGASIDTSSSDVSKDASAAQAQQQPPPVSAGYAITNPVPEVNLDVLDYTIRDWSRWDSFDLYEDMLCEPTRFSDATHANEGSRVWGVGNGQTPVQYETVALPDVPLSTKATQPPLGQPFDANAWLRSVRSKIAHVYYPRGYRWYRGWQRNPTLDWVDNFRSVGRMTLQDSMLNISYGINENYNIFRQAKKDEIRKRILDDFEKSGIDPTTRPIESLVNSEFDSLQIHWLEDMPRNNASVSWFMTYIEAVMSKMCLVPNTIKYRGSDPFDAFGLFEGMDGPGYNQQVMHFYTGDYAYLVGHYLKLFPSSFIRKIRTSIYASLAAQWNVYISRMGILDRLTNQWLLRVIGWTESAYVILRSEAILKARGDWQPSDGWTSTNWPMGQVTNADMLQQAESFMDTLVNRMATVGHFEFQSTYYGYIFDMLSQSMLHAPSQYAYNGLEKIWKMYWTDAAAHWLPGSASFSGSSGRHYDLFSGVGSKVDLWDVPLMMQQMYRTHCALNEMDATEAVSTTVKGDVLNLCSNVSPLVGELSIGTDDFNMLRMLHAGMMVTGIGGYMPYDALMNLTIASPIRTIRSVFSEMHGQERFDFFTPSYQIGFAGEEAYSVSANILLVARLAGIPLPGAPTSITEPNRPTHTIPFIRIMTENNDDPCYRPSLYGVAGMYQQCQSRQVVSQYQSFILWTALLAGSNDMSTTADFQKPWNTNLILPLPVDGLYANEVKLPIADGTVVALPPDVILTVRHGSASIVLRALRFDKQDYIKDATKIQPLTGVSDKYKSGVGTQEYSLTWQVDATTIQAGVGRVVIHHKHRSTTDLKQKHWRVALLWGAGRTRTDKEMYALQRSIRHATYNESIQPLGGWNPGDQPWSGTPSSWPNYDPRVPCGSSLWDASVQIGSDINLRVKREDVYQPWKSDPIYRTLRQGPLNLPPYYLRSFERLVNGKDIFEDLFDWRTDNYNKDHQALHWTAHKEEEWFEPHISAPIDCVPGVDKPCYVWKSSPWTECSATCMNGVQTRTIQCVDASNKDKPTNDTSLCPDNQPAVHRGCNLGPCLPSSPTILKVVPCDGCVDVYFDPPIDDGGATLSGYVAIAYPGVVATWGVFSPIRVSPLKNGDKVSIRVAAANIAGTGEPSGNSLTVIPDKYEWVYSAWSACDAVCNGGHQRRTVACTGSIVGKVSDATLCTTPKPTDLMQSCRTQSCSWYAADWSACSMPCSTGVRTREVYCTDGLSKDNHASSSLCQASLQPKSSEPCNTQLCVWKTKEWGECSKDCGTGQRQRSVACTDGLGAPMSDSVCVNSVGAAPAATEPCNTQPCVTYQWVARAWGPCTRSCGGGSQTRVVDCVSSLGAVSDDRYCESTGPMPTTMQTCGTNACVWHEGGFGACTQPCNTGTRAQTVSCRDDQGLAVSDAWCDAASKPVEWENCNEQECQWQAGPFGTCSATCGTGVTTRAVLCVDNSDTKNNMAVDDDLCKSKPRPETSKACSAPIACILPPSPPTLLNVQPGDGSAYVYFKGSESDGGGEILGYHVRMFEPKTAAALIVSSSPSSKSGSQSKQQQQKQQQQQQAPGVDRDGQPTFAAFDTELGEKPSSVNGWGLTSPIYVGGLINGRSYRFYLVAVNSVGASNASNPSKEVSPFPPPAFAPEITDITLTESSPGLFQLVIYFEHQNASMAKIDITPQGTDKNGSASTTAGGFLSPSISMPPPVFEVLVMPPNITAKATDSPLVVNDIPSQDGNLTVMLWAANPAGKSMGVYQDVPFETAAIPGPSHVGPSTMKPGGAGFAATLSLSLIFGTLAIIAAVYFIRRSNVSRKIVDLASKVRRDMEEEKAKREREKREKKEKAAAATRKIHDVTVTATAAAGPSEEEVISRHGRRLSIIQSGRRRSIVSIEVGEEDEHEHERTDGGGSSPSPIQEETPSLAMSPTGEVDEARVGITSPTGVHSRAAAGDQHDVLASPSAVSPSPPLASPTGMIRSALSKLTSWIRSPSAGVDLSHVTSPSAPPPPGQSPAFPLAHPFASPIGSPSLSPALNWPSPSPLPPAGAVSYTYPTAAPPPAATNAPSEPPPLPSSSPSGSEPSLSPSPASPLPSPSPSPPPYYLSGLFPEPVEHFTHADEENEYDAEIDAAEHAARTQMRNQEQNVSGVLLSEVSLQQQGGEQLKREGEKAEDVEAVGVNRGRGPAPPSAASSRFSSAAPSLAPSPATSRAVTRPPTPHEDE